MLTCFFVCLAITQTLFRTLDAEMKSAVFVLIVLFSVKITEGKLLKVDVQHQNDSFSGITSTESEVEVGIDMFGFE